MSKSDQSSVGSYITGFILSLIFTVIPYYLVVNKTLSGNSLLAAIIGLAAVQVFIQCFFFLHLGRGPKPIYNLAFFGATVGLIIFIVGGSLFIMSRLHYNMTPDETTKQLAEGEAIAQIDGTKTGACPGTKVNHQILIERGAIKPVQTKAQLCDTLSFTNKDSLTRSITFGTFPNPKTYAGQTVVTLRKGASETITLNQLGVNSFYDNLYPELTGSFTVTP